MKDIDPASRTVPKADALPHQRMERQEIRARIDDAIAQLSPEHRAVIASGQDPVAGQEFAIAVAVITFAFVAVGATLARLETPR